MSDVPPAPRSVPEAEYTGEIRRANEDGNEIHGFLIDRHGVRIMLRGCKDPRRGHGYMLYGERAP